MTVVLLRDVEVEGRVTSVLLDGGRVVGLGPAALGRPTDEVVNGRGGALLPGLHDHHLHLFALAAARASVDCHSGLDALRGVPGEPSAWVRGVRLAESVDRHALDAVVPDRPVRVQHRSGALWMLNTVALQEVATALDHSADVERDEHGEPTGRLWRYDERLRAALRNDTPELSDVGRELTSYGLTSVTDATPDLGDSPAFAALPQQVTLLGWRKLLLRDHDLPTLDELALAIARRHEVGDPVAVHCVTAESLVLTLAALDEVGALPGDRIEHAAVVPPGLELELARLGVRVVTQPGFLADRGDAYRRDLPPHEVACLYPFASLLAAGVAVTASSDAPFGPLDPWSVIRAARDRTDPTGIVLGADEQVSAEVALAGYLTDADGRPRRLRAGHDAGVVLLHEPLARVLSEPSADLVRATWPGAPLSRSRLRPGVR